MGGFKSGMVVFMVVMAASMQLQTTVAQTRHVVGDTVGWNIPPNAATYTTWASQQNFTVGDTLVFNFTTGIHNVAEVSQTAFGPCNTANPTSVATTGPATITLTIAGPHYYVCTVGTHCALGQKLAINVSAAPTTPPAAAPTTPPPAATPTPAPRRAPVSPPTTSPAPAPGPSTATPPPPASTPAPSPVGASPPSPPTPTSSPSPSPPTADTTPTPPAPSSAAAFSAVLPATLLAVALALFH